MRLIATLFALILFALPAAADEAVEQLQLANGCWQYTMCKAQSSDADCTDVNGHNYVNTFGIGYTHTLFAESSDSTAFTCTLRIARDAYSSTIYGLTSPAITVTNAVEIAPFSGIVGKSWLNCAGVAGGSSTHVTVYMRSCPLAK